MAPLYATLASRWLDIPRALSTEQSLHFARRAVVAAAPEIAKRTTEHIIARRGLTVNSSQGVTLGLIGAYVVVIALLWNLPYVRWSLWPFKVSSIQPKVDWFSTLLLTDYYRCSSLLSTNLDTQ